jgi:hypothetical protein
MSNPTFTMRHYNKIHALIKSTVDGFKADSNMISLEDINYIAGMSVLHDQLGAMFHEDNPNFKPELWKL